MLAKIWDWLAPHSPSMALVRDHTFQFHILEALIFIKKTHLEEPRMNKTYYDQTEACSQLTSLKCSVICLGYDKKLERRCNTFHDSVH